MGHMIDGEWKVGGMTPDAHGRFVRAATQFRHQVTADGSSGFAPEAGRYHLYVAWACPWAHRTVILRTLRGLENAISLSVVDPFAGEDGWFFSDAPGCIPDPIFGAEFLRDIYAQAQPNYTGRVTVPVLWDRKTSAIVNNESRDIIRMFDAAFEPLATRSTSYCPTELRQQIDDTIDAIYHPINNGVYRAGFARSQSAYEEAVAELFEALGHWDQVLDGQRYLCGSRLTEADWCLFTTLIRFDAVYVGHFKCNRRRIVDFHNLSNYLRELYQIPGVAEVTNFDHIKRHYYQSHESVNPTRIVPVGPDLDFHAPHDRERLPAA